MNDSGNIYYVYAHIRPDTNQIFYIGKGKNYRAHYFKKRNKYWKRIVKKVGKPIVSYLAQGLSHLKALEIEKYYIKKYSDQLSNINTGK